MTQIAIGNTVTDVRGGGYGGRAWIARIVGPDAKFGLAREFCRKDTSGLSGSGRSGHITFEVTQPGLYEFRDFCVGSTASNWNWSGFIILSADGTSEQISRAQAIEYAKAGLLDSRRTDDHEEE